MARKFKITYKLGSTQEVEADRHFTDGSWIVFGLYDGNDEVEVQVLRVPGADVESIALNGTPDRTAARGPQVW